MNTKGHKRKVRIAADVCWLFFIFTAFATYEVWVQKSYMIARGNYTFLFWDSWDSWIPLAWRDWTLWHAYSVPGEFICWFGIGLLIRQLSPRFIGVIFALYALGQNLGTLLGNYWLGWDAPQTMLSTVLTLICIFGGIVLGQGTGNALLALWERLKHRK